MSSYPEEPKSQRKEAQGFSTLKEKFSARIF